MLKTLEGLTDKELDALTPEEIEQVTKYKMMESGVALPFPPEEPVLTEIEAPKHTYCFCEGLFPTIYFQDAEDYKKVLSLLKELGVKGRKRDFGDPASMVLENIRTEKVLRNKYTLITEDAYTPEEMRNNAAALKDNERLRKAYEAAREEYSRVMRDVADVRNEVMEPILAARRRIGEQARMLQRFREYMELSEGDFEVALKFFKNGLHPEGHVVSYLRAEFNCPECKPAVEEEDNA